MFKEESLGYSTLPEATMGPFDPAGDRFIFGFFYTSHRFPIMNLLKLRPARVERNQSLLWKIEMQIVIL